VLQIFGFSSSKAHKLKSYQHSLKSSVILLLSTFPLLSFPFPTLPPIAWVQADFKGGKKPKQTERKSPRKKKENPSRTEPKN